MRFNAPSVLFGFQPATIEAGDFNNDSKADLDLDIGRNSNNFLVLLE